MSAIVLFNLAIYLPQILLLCLEIFLGVLHNEIDDKHGQRKDQKSSQSHPHIDGQHHHKHTDQGGN